MIIKKPVEIKVAQAYDDEEFHSDMLYSVDNTTNVTPFKEAVLFSIIGNKNDIENIMEDEKKIVIKWEKQDFTIQDLGEYKEQKIPLKDPTGNLYKYVYAKRTDQYIQKDDEGDKESKVDSVPYELVNHVQGKRKVAVAKALRHVKNKVTIPMFPNVDQYMILAGQMFIDKEEAKEILDVINGVSNKAVNMKHLNRAKYLLKTLDEWREYIFHEMTSKGLIQKADRNFSTTDIEILKIMIDEKKIEKIVVEGVKSGALRMSKRHEATDKITNFNDYMRIFAEAMAKRIESLVKPIHRRGDIRPAVTNYFTFLKREPLGAQKDVIEASLKSLELQNKVNVIGECGVGKTFVMLATNWIHARMQKRAMKLLAFCPDHIVDTVWEEEVHDTLHDCHVHKINSIQDVMEFEKMGYLDDNEDRVFVLSQQVAKSGYSLRPSAIWSKAKQTFTCPDCGEIVKKKKKNDEWVTGEPKYIQVPVDFEHFRTQRYNNYKCKNCEAVLWEPLNKEGSKMQFVYSKMLRGFYPKDAKPIDRHIKKDVYDLNDIAAKHKVATGDKKKELGKKKKKLEKHIKKYRDLELIIKGKRKEGRRVSPRRVSVAEYISKKMRYRFTHLIIDEFHEFQGDSARSDACVQLISSIKYVQTGTGTGMNGYAYSRFKTDYMLYPEKMKKEGFKITDKEKYQSTFGVTEKRYRLKEEDGRTKKDTLAPVPRPGISPVIFPLFMQDTTVFLTLEDLRDDLPPLIHSQIEVEMDEGLKKAADKLEGDMRALEHQDKKLIRSSMQIGYSFLDSPQKEKELRDEDGDIVLKTPVVPSHVDKKLEALKRFAHEEVRREGRKIMIYTYYTGDKINEYLYENLVNEGYNVTLLNKQEEASISCDGTKEKVKKPDREKFIREEVKKDTEIMIVNPELIKTGYNLMDFPTICYYQMGYQVYTNRQADRRAWRIGQKQTCKIVYMYYEDTIQQSVASIMATKIVASQAIEGKMDAQGLKNITLDRTAEEEMAEMFFEGIRGKVNLKSYHEDKKEDRKERTA